MLPFNANISRQSSQWNSKFRSGIHPSTNDKEDYSADHESASKGFHLLSNFRIV